MSPIQAEDVLIFYVSGGYDPGYVALGDVTCEVVTDHTPLWEDDVYPFRVTFRARYARRRALPRQRVMEELGLRRLKHQRPQSVIPLSPEEYRIISTLIVDEKEDRLP